ncbi:hypothetical protein [Emticicia sp. SJ17W-69]|uniref:hypothetical protein n=1 Tax=Emticicia sp. SJ17W-69 TaxID=3421657 RepID=UPI003EB8F748
MEQRKSANFAFNFNKIDLKCNFLVRDVWQLKDLGNFKDSFKTNIRPQGVII